MDNSAQEGWREVLEDHCLGEIGLLWDNPQDRLPELTKLIETFLLQQRTEIEESVRGVVEKHHLTELETLMQSNNQESTKVHISKGFEIYKTALLTALDKLFAKP